MGKFSDELLELRRDLHAHPELSWREIRTTELVCARSRAPAGGSAECPRRLVAEIGDDGPGSRCGPTWTRCRWPT